jgi:DNA-binding NarL/FixJ family response regulator
VRAAQRGTFRFPGNEDRKRHISRTQAGLRERAMKLGAVAFLQKPFDATTLADQIESALSPGDNWRPQAKASAG